MSLSALLEEYYTEQGYDTNAVSYTHLYLSIHINYYSDTTEYGAEMCIRDRY